MSEPLTHSRLAGQRTNSIALPQTFSRNGDFNHDSDHISNRTLHNIVINQSAKYQ